MINKDNFALINAYIADENATEADLEALEKRGDVFLKEETIADDAGVKTQIEAITTDTDKQEALLIAMNAFYKYMPNAEEKKTITIS